MCVCVCVRVRACVRACVCVRVLAAIILLICRAEQLNVEVFGQFGIPPDGQVVFSSSSMHYLSSHTRLTPQQFSELLDGAGGKQGHAILYLLPIPQVQSEKLQPDFSCLSKLSESARPPHSRQTFRW